MYCADCESIDDYFFKVTHFWIFVPTVETFGKLAGLCGSLELKANQESSHCISCAVEQSQIQKFLTSVNGALESKELEIILSDNILSEIIKKDEKFLGKNNQFSRIKYEKFLITNNFNAAFYEKNLKDEQTNKLLFTRYRTV